MELLDYYMDFLLLNSTVKLEELDKIYNSIKKAVELKQYFELHNDGKFCGFLTWEIRASKSDKDKIDLGITNLVIQERCRGQYPLIKAINHLRKKYPNIDKFIWKNRRKNRLFEAKQKDKLCLATS